MSNSATLVPPPGRLATAGRQRRLPDWARHNAKYGAALALVAATAYAALSGQGYVASDNAVISTYTVSLRAPITGYVSGVHVKVGTPVAAGTLLAHLDERRVDDQRLVDLENLLARHRAEKEASERERDQLSQQRAALIGRSAERDRSEAVFLTLEAAEAEHQVRAREAASEYARREFERIEQLGRSGDVSVAAVDKARAAAYTTERDAEASIARLAYLRVQADAAHRGMLLESGSNDVPYSSQRADEIAVRLAEIEREIAGLIASETETASRLGAEQRRVALLRGADIVVPTSGMVWKLGASDGERLSVGDAVAELVDCQSEFVIAEIPQDRYSDVEIGGTARVRLSGDASDRLGHVVSVTGEATLANDRNLAAAPLAQRGATAMAWVKLAGSGNTASECLVGRTARALLPTSPDNSFFARLARSFF